MRKVRMHNNSLAANAIQEKCEYVVRTMKRAIKRLNPDDSVEIWLSRMLRLFQERLRLSFKIRIAGEQNNS